LYGLVPQHPQWCIAAPAAWVSPPILETRRPCHYALASSFSIIWTGAWRCAALRLFARAELYVGIRRQADTDGAERLAAETGYVECHRCYHTYSATLVQPPTRHQIVIADHHSTGRYSSPATRPVPSRLSRRSHVAPHSSR